MSQGLVLTVVDDHPPIATGVFAGLSPLLRLATEQAQPRHSATIAALLECDQPSDVVLLDIHLQDEQDPQRNVISLVERGWKVLLYTQEHRPVILARCLDAGAMGIVRKHEDFQVLAEAIGTVRVGETFFNADLAGALEARKTGRVPHLSPREQLIIHLVATGLPLKSVARRLSIAEETVKEHLRRVRRKYSAAGRPTGNQAALVKNATEDGFLFGFRDS